MMLGYMAYAYLDVVGDFPSESACLQNIKKGGYMMVARFAACIDNLHDICKQNHMILCVVTVMSS